ncbi:hypothetical protein Ciccas_011433, partial [Cichlidogyrus casuarinus]
MKNEEPLQPCKIRAKSTTSPMKKKFATIQYESISKYRMRPKSIAVAHNEMPIRRNTNRDAPDNIYRTHKPDALGIKRIKSIEAGKILGASKARKLIKNDPITDARLVSYSDQVQKKPEESKTRNRPNEDDLEKIFAISNYLNQAIKSLLQSNKKQPTGDTNQKIDSVKELISVTELKDGIDSAKKNVPIKINSKEDRGQTGISIATKDTKEEGFARNAVISEKGENNREITDYLFIIKEKQEPIPAARGEDVESKGGHDDASKSKNLSEKKQMKKLEKGKYDIDSVESKIGHSSIRSSDDDSKIETPSKMGGMNKPKKQK